ncbi:ABC transporter substrate-binding protein [Treponema endosymbiont of Eucomonympha sp.]|uniref:ABC transporter substrate-binding protein n=3 Tax=Treponema endosymbiont of Eucomonympha sp. TaxID=1580831 RepID=UPI000B199017|nr:ABC transporter substrate-binding protein [Treponema endosymbiont of Eucomonympha sp.]
MRIITVKNRLSAMFPVLVLTGIVLIGASGCSKKTASASAASDALTIRVGADSAAFSYQFRVAKKAGIFDKYHINAEISTFSYGIDTLNAALLGETDSAEAMDFAIASRFSESNKMRILATILISNPAGSRLYVRNDAIRAPGDIAGKRIGVQKATSNEYLWARFFEKWGIDKNTVNHVYLGSNAELLAAYLAKEIDAFWASSDIEKAVLEVPSSRSIGDYSLSGYVGKGYLLLDANFIAKNPEGTERFLKALDEATTFIAQHPDETAQYAYEDLKVPVDAARTWIGAYEYMVRLSQEDLDQIADVAKWSIENGLIKNRYDIRDFVDIKPLQNALPDRVTITN